MSTKQMIEWFDMKHTGQVCAEPLGVSAPRMAHYRTWKGETLFAAAHFL